MKLSCIENSIGVFATAQLDVLDGLKSVFHLKNEAFQLVMGCPGDSPIVKNDVGGLWKVLYETR